MRAALHDHAAALLRDLGIGEPVTWTPPGDCCAGLNLPGPDPDDIDLDAVRQLAVTGGLPVASAAARLSVSTEHVRLALERVPRPARNGAATRCRSSGNGSSATLYQPSAPGQPMRPTACGAGLLDVLARPDIQALTARQAPAVTGPASGNPRYRERMPAGPGSSAEAAQQAAGLFRALADPTRLSILLALQAGERRTVDLTAELGGSQASISFHLASLKQCGLITGRPNGRAVYYRLARPELGPLLHAAEQLLAASGLQTPPGQALQA